MEFENQWWQVTNQVLDAAFHAATGTHTTEFDFVIGETPLSEIWHAAAGLVGYLAVVFGLWWIMKERKEMPLKSSFAVHNLLLTIASSVLLLLLLELILPKLLTHGLYWTLCSSECYDDRRLRFAYYLNYLSKFWELIDTVFLVLQKKPLKFLHVYHHSLTMVLCFTQLRGVVTVQWVPILLNVFVHVVMYYYYYLTAIGKKVWWKQHVTTIQIAQFVVDLVACYYALYTAYAHFYNWWPHHGDCAGDFSAGWWGCFLLTTYLYLFIEFFYNMYINPKGKKQTKTVAPAPHTNGVDKAD